MRSRPRCSSTPAAASGRRRSGRPFWGRARRRSRSSPSRSSAGLRRRAGPRRGRRPVQPVDVPPDGRGRCQEPRRPEGVDRAARGRQRRNRVDVRVGHHLVPVPRHARRSAAGRDRRPRARHDRGRADVRALERPLRRDGRLVPELATVTARGRPDRRRPAGGTTGGNGDRDRPCRLDARPRSSSGSASIPTG